MASTSTLTPDNFPAGRDRILGKGHGTAALGPSDSSDSGSDVAHAGPELGDADLDSDSDRFGTGERASATRDTSPPEGADINVDHIVDLEDPEALGNLEDLDGAKG